MAGSDSTRVTERLANFVSELEPADIPRSAVEMAKRCVLDLIGAASAGSLTPAAMALRDLAIGMFSPGPTSIWFSVNRTHPAGAALANSAAASALDLDDGHRAAGGHPGASIIPAVFATAEEIGASGLEVLAAIIIGYEVAVRIAAARDFSKLDTLATGRWSSYGAAAADCWLRRIAPQKMAHALAIAGVQAPSLVAFGYTSLKGNNVKESIPWSTLTGLAAARLAAMGFTGPADLLDHPSHFAPSQILQDLGRNYAIERVYFKPYSCCRWIHGAIDAITALQTEHSLHPDEITTVHVYTFRRALALNNYPNPTSLEAAQYSVPYCIAVAACEGPQAFLPLSPSLLSRERLVAFARRTKLHLDPTLDALFPAHTAARVLLETARGHFEKQVTYPLGDPTNPMDLPHLIRKFRNLTYERWSTEQQDQLIATVQSLENSDRLLHFIELLGPPLSL